MRSATSCVLFTAKGAENQGSERCAASRTTWRQDRASLVGGAAIHFQQRPMKAVACLLSILVCLGCSSLRVQQMQSRAARGDDTWIAAQAVDCDTVSPDCGQLHLIKGDACLRLAESGRQPADHYACAADELAKGIALKPTWKDVGEQRGVHERHCDALDGLQALQSGAAANQTLDRLLEAAQALYQLAPESVPAIYYLSIARLRQLEPRLSTVNAANRLPVCSRLKRTVNRVLSLMETARHERLPEWDRFAGRYQRLAFDLGAAMHTAECR